MKMGGSISLLSLMPLVVLIWHSELLLLPGTSLCLRKLDSCLSCGKPVIHLLLVSKQLLDARTLLHALEMRRDVGEA